MAPEFASFNPDHLPLRASWQREDDGGIRFPLGWILPSNEPWILREADLSRHVFVCGASGSGKSRLLRLLIRLASLSGWVVFVLDGGGELYQDVILDIGAMPAERQVELLPKLYLVDPGDIHKTIGWDILRVTRNRSLPEPLQTTDYLARLKARAETLATVFQREHGGSFAVAVQAKRYLTTVFVAGGLVINNLHVPTPDLEAIIDRNHIDHAVILQRILRYLAPEYVGDLLAIESARTDTEALALVGSSINRMRSEMGPGSLVRAMWGRQGEKTLDLEKILRSPQGGVVLMNLRGGRHHCSDEQANCFGGAALELVLAETQALDRFQRRRVLVVVDEFHRFTGTGSSLEFRLKEQRKNLTTICLSTTDLGGFEDNPGLKRAVKACKTRICFNLEIPEDLVEMARSLGLGLIDWNRLIHEVDRPRKHPRWIRVMDVSVSRGRRWGGSKGKQETGAKSREVSKSRRKSRKYEVGVSNEEGKQETQSEVHGSGRQEVERPIMQDGKPEMVPTQGSQENTQNGVASGVNEKHGVKRSVGEGEDEGQAVADGVTQGSASSVTEEEGRSEDETESYRWVPWTEHWVEQRDTGQLTNGSPNDQLLKIEQCIFMMPAGFAVAKQADLPKAFLVQVCPVEDPLQNPEAQRLALEWIKQKIYDQHGELYFQPDLSVEEQQRRMQQFLCDALPPALAAPDSIPDESVTDYRDAHLDPSCPYDF